MWCSYLRGESVKSLVSKVAQRGQAFSVRGFPCSSFYPQVHRCLRGPPACPCLPLLQCLISQSCACSCTQPRRNFLTPGSMGLSASLRMVGGGGEIRTRGTLRPVGFQDRCIRPLCHPSFATHTFGGHAPRRNCNVALSASRRRDRVIEQIREGCRRVRARLHHLGMCERCGVQPGGPVREA